jgi:hypothetical protein
MRRSRFLFKMLILLATFKTFQQQPFSKLKAENRLYHSPHDTTSSGNKLSHLFASVFHIGNNTLAFNQDRCCRIDDSLIGYNFPLALKQEKMFNEKNTRWQNMS